MRARGALRAGWLVLAAAGFSLFSGLGLWQLERARVKEQLLARFAAARAAPPLPWAEAERRLGADGEAALPLRTSLAGHFDAARLVYHDHRIDEGRPGLHAIAVFRPEGGRRALLVNLGWVASAPGSPPPPPPALPEVVTAISGLLVAPPGVGLKLENPAWREGAAPPRLVHLDLAALEAQFGIALVPAVLLLDPQHPLGLERRWRPLPNTLPPERHRGYALQWFGLAATVAVATALLARRGRHA